MVALCAALFASPVIALPLLGADAAITTLVVSWLLAVGVFAVTRGGDRSLTATARADPRGLWIGEILVVPRSPTIRAEVVRREPIAIVHVRKDRFSAAVRVATPTEDEARALVGALGGDTLSGFRRFVLPSWRWGSPFMTYLLYTGASAMFMVLCWAAAYEVTRASALLGALFATLALVVLAAPVVVASLARVVATIGGDGVHVASRLGSEWLPWSAIAAIRPMGTGAAVSPAVDIELRDGRTVRLYTMPERAKSSTGSDPVLAALHEARVAPQATEGDSRPARLHRDGRTLREWINALRSPKTLERGYRELPLSAADLLALVLDTRASEEERAAAGVALAASPEADVRDKLRVALDEVAAPRVRVALEASLESDDESLAHALDRVTRAVP